MRWNIAEAKQRLSELLRSSQKSPQRIYNRSQLVAVVVAPETFEAFEAWRKSQKVLSLAERFEELRSICAEEAYVLELPGRQDRLNAFVE